MDNSAFKKTANSICRGYNLYLEMIDKFLDISAEISKDSETAVRILNSGFVRKTAPYVVLASAYVDFSLLTLAIIKKRCSAGNRESEE